VGFQYSYVLEELRSHPEYSKGLLNQLIGLECSNIAEDHITMYMFIIARMSKELQKVLQQMSIEFIVEIF